MTFGIWIIRSYLRRKVRMSGLGSNKTLVNSRSSPKMMKFSKCARLRAAAAAAVWDFLERYPSRRLPESIISFVKMSSITKFQGQRKRVQKMVHLFVCLFAAVDPTRSPAFEWMSCTTVSCNYQDFRLMEDTIPTKPNDRLFTPFLMVSFTVACTYCT